MTIISNEKIELNYDNHDKVFILTVYDKYGHFVDDIVFSREEMSEIFELLKVFMEG